MPQNRRKISLADDTLLVQPGIDSPWDQAGCDVAEEVLLSSGRLRLRVHGSSMLPAIWPGDVVTVVREGVNHASIGDVVLFSRDGGLVAHRIVNRVDAHGGARLTTRGDSLPVKDSPNLTVSEVLGRVIGVERGSRPVNTGQTSGGRIVAWLCAHSEIALRIVLKIHKTGRDLRSG